MLYEGIFVAINLLVAPVWLLMVVAPGWSGTDRAVRSAWAPLAVAAVYLVLVLTHMGVTDGHFFSLDGVSRLFTHRAIVLVGWAHYLCFDLLVGSWMFRDARRIELPHWLLVLCLLATLMYGPIGLLSYFGVRAWRTRELMLLS